MHLQYILKYKFYIFPQPLWGIIRFISYYILLKRSVRVSIRHFTSHREDFFN